MICSFAGRDKCSCAERKGSGAGLSPIGQLLPSISGQYKTFLLRLFIYD